MSAPIPFKLGLKKSPQDNRDLKLSVPASS